ncbi:hypothetical protein N431DRAFT_480150 [Stipitochalara longipes BDJ]|nr:hypothetical protein N431DRAFT_480150 [Stipitochalara longipes BDJ]
MDNYRPLPPLSENSWIRNNNLFRANQAAQTAQPAQLVAAEHNQDAGAGESPANGDGDGDGPNQTAPPPRLYLYRRVFKWGMLHHLEAYRPGLVISFPHHVLSYDDDMIETQERTLTNNGHWVFTKRRKFIVIETHFHHCITIPMFTRQGNGLANVRNPWEYIGVRDSHSEGPPPSESIHPNILVEKHSDWRGSQSHVFHNIDPRAHAKWTAPVCFDYNRPCEIEGRVRYEADLKRLIELYYSNAPCNEEKDNNNDEEADPRSSNI